MPYDLFYGSEIFTIWLCIDVNHEHPNINIFMKGFIIFFHLILQWKLRTNEWVCSNPSFHLKLVINTSISFNLHILLSYCYAYYPHIHIAYMHVPKI